MPKHAERRRVPYSPVQLYDLVADIERYPEFLPWCAAARIRRREAAIIVADLAIGFGMFRERFTSRVTLHPPPQNRPEIDMQVIDGPFRHLAGYWRFEACEGGCDVEFHIDFEFRSLLLQATVEMLFHEAVRRMVGAFEQRARQLYG